MGWTADHLAHPAEWLEIANTGCSHFLLGTSHLHFGNGCVFPILCGLVDVIPAPPLATSSSEISDAPSLATSRDFRLLPCCQGRGKES